MPIPSAFVTRFFQLVTERQFAEAERVLHRLRQRMQKTEWNSGYFLALYGLLLAQRSNSNPHAFVSSLDSDDKKALQNYRREFFKYARSRLRADYDRGFFSAWSDYMRVLSKTNLGKTENPKEETSRE